MPKLFDCFTFFNELDLLEIRLNELGPVVDRFVLAEAPVTFRGQVKPLHFQENRERFTPFLDRITHIVVDSDAMPTGQDEAANWARQHVQRNALARGISGADPDDLILLSDVDEIPRRDVLSTLKEHPPSANEVVCFELRAYYYFVNLEAPTRWLRNGPRCLLRRNLPAMQTLRNVRGSHDSAVQDLIRGVRTWLEFGKPVRRSTVRDAGWHFGYVGGLAAIQEKMKSISGGKHTPSDFADMDKLRHRIGRQIGVGNDEPPLTVRRLDESFPPYLREHRDRFAGLVADDEVLSRLRV